MRPRYFLLASLVIGLLATTTVVQAQRTAPLLKKGDQAMAQSDYYTAMHYFGQALALRPAPEVRLRLAEAAYALKAYPVALVHYQTLAESAAAPQFPKARLGWGLCLLQQGQYAAAATQLEQFLTDNRGDNRLTAVANNALANCRWAKHQAPDDRWQVARLPRRINSPYGEFGAYKLGDTLYYTSYQFEKKGDKHQPPRKISKVMFSTDEQRGRELGRGFNADTLLTAHTALGPGRRQLFFTRCQYTQGAQIRCWICVRDQDKRGRWAAAFTELPAAVNAPGYTSTQPAVMYDSSAQVPYLLFVSDRPGGQGGMDIWQVPIPERGQPWGQPVVMAAINSAGSEVAPYFDEYTQRLYFSSDTGEGFGGYDLFVADYLGAGQWVKAKNLGAGLNSSYDDTYPFVQGDSLVYFSSNRPGGRYLDEDIQLCCPDLFKAQLRPSVVAPAPDTSPSVPTVAQVNTPKPKPVPTTLQDFLPLTLYFDNDEPEPRTRKTTTAQSYADTYFSYLKREEVYYEQYSDYATLQDSVAAFFEQGVTGGYQNLDRFSEILWEQLKQGQRVEIFLKGYTSPRAQGDYNLLLGKRRVSAVRNHFTRWRQGLLRQYVDAGQLVISEVSFGETRAAASAQDERAGERTSIYDPTAARERRVEVVEARFQ